MHSYYFPKPGEFRMAKVILNHIFSVDQIQLKHNLRNEHLRKMQNTTRRFDHSEKPNGYKETKINTNENWETIKGKTSVLFENYNSDGGSRGYNSEHRMNLCPGGEITTYEQSHTSIYIEGADASSASEDADSGTWQVYEDEGGNLFLKIKMKKSGEGFVNFQLKDGKLIMGGQSYSIGKGEC